MIYCCLSQYGLRMLTPSTLISFRMVLLLSIFRYNRNQLVYNHSPSGILSHPLALLTVRGLDRSPDNDMGTLRFYKNVIYTQNMPHISLIIISACPCLVFTNTVSIPSSAFSKAVLVRITTGKNNSTRKPPCMVHGLSSSLRVRSFFNSPLV